MKNQQRFHLGYHYPRSKQTVYEIKDSSNDFTKFYGKKIFGNTQNIYAVSNIKSKINFNEYCRKIKKFNLKVRKKKINIFSPKITDSIITNERNLNYFKLKKIIKNKIKNSKNINLKLGKTISKKNLNDYNKVVLCAYSNNNLLLNKLGFKKTQLQKKRYELVEKIVVKLPKKLKKISLVILDGNFLNFDPFIGTKYHLLSVVKESKIEIKKGKFPNFENPKKRFLKYEFVKNLKQSNFRKFINFGEKFVPLLSQAKYIKSCYVIRCVNTSKNNQERKTKLNFYGKKIITVFSGKWSNCAKISKQLTKII